VGGDQVIGRGRLAARRRRREGERIGRRCSHGGTAPCVIRWMGWVGGEVLLGTQSIAGGGGKSNPARGRVGSSRPRGRRGLSDGGAQEPRLGMVRACAGAPPGEPR
jgi:hypothetical protein